MKISEITKRTGVGVVKLSLGLGLSRAAASQWGDTVPHNRVLDVCEYLEWKVTPHQVRPDLYPNPGDALPHGVPIPSSESVAESTAAA